MLLYEDKDGCTAMGNAQKPTPQTWHIDIKYFSLCDWVERDLMLLDRIDTSINMADHLMKALQPTLFHRHTNFLFGHIPPTYSPVYPSIIGHFPTHTPNIDLFVPTSFTTQLTACTGRTMHLSRRTISTIHGSASSAWVVQSNIPCRLSLPSTFGLWGGVSV
jgi:hypothetical protein